MNGKKQWSKVSKEKRKAHASMMAHALHTKRTPAERSEHARMMALARHHKNATIAE